MPRYRFHPKTHFYTVNEKEFYRKVKSVFLIQRHYKMEKHGILQKGKNTVDITSEAVKKIDIPIENTTPPHLRQRLLTYVSKNHNFKIAINCYSDCLADTI